MITVLRRYCKKPFALLISCSVMVAAPGPFCWQSLAQQSVPSSFPALNEFFRSIKTCKESAVLRRLPAPDVNKLDQLAWNARNADVPNPAALRNYRNEFLKLASDLCPEYSSVRENLNRVSGSASRGAARLAAFDPANFDGGKKFSMDQASPDGVLANVRKGISGHFTKAISLTLPSPAKRERESAGSLSLEGRGRGEGDTAHRQFPHPNPLPDGARGNSGRSVAGSDAAAVQSLASTFHLDVELTRFIVRKAVEMSIDRFVPYILGIAPAASNNNPLAVSKAGARGLFQIMPSTARWLGFDPSRLFDRFYNATVALTYFKYLLNKFNWNPVHAVTAYVEGEGRLAHQLQRSGNRNDSENKNDRTEVYAAARAYVHQVLSGAEKLTSELPEEMSAWAARRFDSQSSHSAGASVADVQGKGSLARQAGEGRVRARDGNSPSPQSSPQRGEGKDGEVGEQYDESKLAQIYDLKHPEKNVAALERLGKIKKENEPYLATSGDNPGGQDSVNAWPAFLKKMQLDVRRALGGPPDPRTPRRASDPLVREHLKKIEETVKAWETMTAQAQGDFALNRAQDKLLQLAEQARREKDRELGKQMMEVHGILAKQSTLADSTYGLKIINGLQGAENALNQAIALNNQKIQAVQNILQNDKQGLAAALRNQQNIPQWTKDAQQTIDQDNAQNKNLKTLHDEAQSAHDDVQSVSAGLNGFLSTLDSQDGDGSKGSALAAYQNDLNLIPKVLGYMTNGGSPNSNDQSLAGFNDQLATAQKDLQLIRSGLAQLQAEKNTIPQGFYGVLIPLVPRIPDPGVANWSTGAGGPNVPALLSMLSARQAYWQQQLNSYTNQLDQVKQKLSSSPQGSVIDDFGNSNPASLFDWKNQDQQKITQYRQTLQSLIGSATGGNQGANTINQLAQAINGVAPGSLPILVVPSGPGDSAGLQTLETALQKFTDALPNVSLPSQDTSVNFQAKMDLLLIANLLPQAAYTTIHWAKADAEITAINQAIPVLQQVQPALQGLVCAIQASAPGCTDPSAPSILTDVAADIAYLNSSSTSDSIISRKITLTQALETAIQNMISPLNQLIAFQSDSLKNYQSDPNVGFDKLFTQEINLYKGVQNALSQTIPWALASYGAPYGNASAATPNIAAQATKYQNYLNDSTDSNGQSQEGLINTQKDINDRLADVGKVSRTETLYGETQPYNLNDKIKQYGPNGEMALRATQFNADAAVINKILGDMDPLLNAAKDPQNLVSRFKLQANVGVDANSIAYMNRLADKTNPNDLQALGNAITQIGNKYKALANAPSFGSVSAASPPVGKQPSPTLANLTMIADLALRAGERLTVSPYNTQPNADSAADALIRYLYSNGVYKAASDGIFQANTALPVVQQGIATLNAAIADLKSSPNGNDQSYVNNPKGEAPDHVINRKLNIYLSLASFTAAAGDLYGKKAGWDTTTLNNISQIQTYYSGLVQMDQSAITLANSEISEGQQINKSLQDLYNQLEAQRKKLQNWQPQINNPLCTAMCQMADVLGGVNDAMRQILLSNKDVRQADERYKRSKENLKWEIGQADLKRRELEELLKGLGDPDALYSDPAFAGLAKRIDAMETQNSGAWLLGGNAPEGAQAIVVRKSGMASFVDQFFSVFQKQFAGQDVGALASQVLSDPMSLASLLPHHNMIDMSGGSDPFYMIYDAEISVPNGLATSRSVSAGNDRISVTGYESEQPSNVRNAAYGDRGADTQIKLRGDNWVDYVDFGFHRFSQDAGADLSVLTTAGESRLFVMDNYAAMLMNGKVYLAANGYGDWALSNQAQRPTYYGGSAKTSVQFTPIVSLTAEQQAIFIRDPRCFLETFNLDFTGFDNLVDQNFVINACAGNHSYARSQVGPSVNVGKLLSPDSKNQFTVDFYWSRQGGTDDYAQQAGGVRVLNGFTIKRSDGKPFAEVANQGTFEEGAKFGTIGDRITVKLPKSLVFTGEGRDVGGALVYNGSISKEMNSHARFKVGYGNSTVGENKRLVIGVENNYTMSQLWNEVVHHAEEDLSGGEPLKDFNGRLEDLFKAQTKGQEDNPTPKGQVAAGLQGAFFSDPFIKLLSEQIGGKAHDIRDQRQAASLFSNTRIRSLIGFTSRPVSNELITRALAGGMASGVDTSMMLKRKDDVLTALDIQDMVRLGLELKARFIRLTEDNLQAIGEITKARYEVRMAQFEAQKSPSEVGRKEGEARLAAAMGRLHQAQIRYNMLMGRPTNADIPEAFKNLDTEDLDELAGELRKTLAVPENLTAVLAKLNPEEIQNRLGPESFNWMKFIPFVDQITFRVGLQIPDILGGQQFGIGGIVEKAIYNPAKKARDKARRLEKGAASNEIVQMYAQFALTARQEASKAEFLSHAYPGLRSEAQRAAQHLDWAMAGYRNHELSEDREREAFDAWRWSVGQSVEAAEQGALAAAWSGLDKSMAFGPVRKGGTVVSLDEAFSEGEDHSPNLSEIGQREQAAQEMALADARRLQMLALDVSIGSNLTESGLGWLPSVGLTTVGISPVLVVDVKSRDLADLDRLKGEAENRMYGLLRQKVKVNLAVGIFQSAAAFETSGEAAAQMDREVLPQLQAELARAQAAGDASQIAAAQARLQQKQFERGQIELARSHAGMTLNYLLGRAPGDPVQATLDLDAALARLKEALGKGSPAAVGRGILEERLKQALAEETKIDLNLKPEHFAAEPMSMIVGKMGQLVRTLADPNPVDPEKALAAHNRTQQAQRALDSFDTELAVGLARIRSELAKTIAEISDAKKQGDPESRLRCVQLTQKKYELESSLAALGSDAAVSGRRPGSVPSTYAELKDSVESAFENAADPAEERAQDAAPQQDDRTQDALSHARFSYYHESLDRTVINQGRPEGWAEVKFNSPDTSARTRMKLAELQKQRQDLFRKISAAEARGRGNILMAQFSADVRLLGVLDEESKRQVNQLLSAQRNEIVALLNLPADTTLESLEHLVLESPEGGAAPENLQNAAERTIADIRGEGLNAVQHQLLVAGLSPGFASREGLMDRLRIEAIARQFSYKGFTVETVWGSIRGKTVGGPFLQLPDLEEIQNTLEHTLPKALVEQLVARGEMRQRTMALQLLMQKVRDGAKQVEADHNLVPAAEDHYRAVAELADHGSLGGGDRLAAQDALSEAWTRLARDVTELQGDFATLVTELEAIGLGDRGDTLRFGLGDDSSAPKPARFDPTEEILRYASRRMVDEKFVSQFDTMLVGQGMSQTTLRSDLSRKADLYRRMAEDSEAVRSMDLSIFEKRDYLAKADPEGLRQDIQALLAPLASDPAWTEVLKFLDADLKSEVQKSEVRLADGMRLDKRMNDSYWHAVQAPAVVEGARRRLETLYRGDPDRGVQGLLGAQQSLLEGFATTSMKPTDFVMRDSLLDDYLKAQQAFDDELIKTFELDEVRKDPAMASGLTGLYNLAAVLSRQEDRVRYGRGLGAIDALIMLQESRMAALRHDRAPRDEQEEAAGALSDLKATRARWKSQPWGLMPLYGLAELDAQGRPVWSIKDWYTQKQIDDWGHDGKIKTEKDGRRYLVGEDGKKREVISGVDLAESQRDEAQAAYDQNTQDQKLFQTLGNNDFALTDMDGTVEKGLSYGEVSALLHGSALSLPWRGDATLFFFQAAADKSGLHPAVPPTLAMQWKKDGNLSSSPSPLGGEDKGEGASSAFALPEMIVYDAGDGKSAFNIPRERFPTKESLEQYMRQLRASSRAEDQAEAAKFHRLEAGEKGVRAMATAAGTSRDRHLGEGWMKVKMKAYGFAMDADNSDPNIPAEVYVTRQDFETEFRSMRTASHHLAQTERALEEAKAELKGAHGTEAANEEYQKAKKAAEDRLEPIVRKDLKLPEHGKLYPEHLQRVRAEVEMRLAKDPEFLKAQKRFNDQVRPFVKQGETLDVLQRRVDIASAEVENAQRLIVESGKRRLYETRDLALLVDGDRHIVGVSAKPAFGGAELRGEIRTPVGKISEVRGTIYAAEMRDGRLVRAYTREDEVERAAEHWALVGVDGKPVDGTVERPLPQGKKVAVHPYFRLLYYENPDTQTPIILNRSYLVERDKNAKKDAKRARHYAFSGWNLAKLATAIPVAAAKEPVAIVTGGDPNQSGYLGEVRAHKAYAGVETHRNFMRRAFDHVDVLELDPTHPDSALDPGQVDAVVETPTLKPGGNLVDRPARDGKNDVHFNLGAAQRARQEDEEDIGNIKDEILGDFNGDVESILIETHRSHPIWKKSKDGFTSSTYETSSIFHAPGIEKALRDPAVLNHDSGDGAGGEETVVPGRVDVEKIVKRVRVRPGARQDAVAEKNLNDYSGSVAAREKDVLNQEKAEDLRRHKDESAQEFNQRVQRYKDVSDAAQSAWDASHPPSGKRHPQRKGAHLKTAKP